MLTKAGTSGTTNYGWDLENRLSSVNLPAGGGTVSFQYDPFGRRIEKTTASGSTVYLYDGANIVSEVNSSGAVVASYTQGLGIDEPLAMKRNGYVAYYNADGLGSITSMNGASGAPVASYVYDSFGNTTTTEGIFNPFRYTGREQDPETSLYYYRARYYDPTIGRFISEDPIGFSGGINFYRYVENSPTSDADPSGLFPKNKDKWWGYNDKHFRMWWHRCYWKGSPYDGTREDVELAYEIWNSLGRPKNGDCGGKKERCPDPEPSSKPVENPDDWTKWLKDRWDELDNYVRHNPPPCWWCLVPSPPGTQPQRGY